MLKSQQQLAEDARREIPEVQVDDINKDINKGGGLPFLLVDVREPNEHEQGIIPGATMIPRGILEAGITKVTQDENLPVICYCGGGTRSLFAAQQLHKMGFTNVKSMAGGYRAWVQSGNPVVKP